MATMSVKNQLVEEANSIIDRAKAIHKLYCQTYDVALDTEYQALLRQYKQIMLKLKVIDKAFVDSFLRLALNRAKDIDARIEALTEIYKATSDTMIEKEITNLTDDYSRIVDQAKALGITFA